MSLNPKYLVAVMVVLAFIAGNAAMWGYQTYRQPEETSWETDLYGGLFNDEFFNQSRSPFTEMDRIRKQMDDILGRNSGLARSPLDFDGWFNRKYGSFSVGQIDSREDRDYVYYELNVGDQDVGNIQVETENGYVKISAKLSHSETGKRSETNISQRFPIPASVDPNSVAVEHEDDVIVIRFSKTE